ncbi:hypothetical protein N310_12959, partial [Acanthisitta chloris]
DSEVFEAVLPVTIILLRDEDFLQGDAPPVPEVEEELNLNSICLKSDVTPSNDSSVSSWEENKPLSNKDNDIKHSEEKCFAEHVCNTSKSSLSDGCGAYT